MEEEIFYSSRIFYGAMINTHSKRIFSSKLTLALLATISSGYILFSNGGVFMAANAQPLTAPSGGMNMSMSGNQTMGSSAASGLVPYNNPNLGFSLEYPSDWQKKESLSFASPQGTGDRSLELITVDTEVLPSSDFSLDSYTEAAMRQVEAFQNFQLLNSSSTSLGGLPAHMIEYTFTDETQTPLQSFQAWTVKDGMAYVMAYIGVPEEFESSLPALQSVLDSFSLE
jgi:hypothetical protein